MSIEDKVQEMRDNTVYVVRNLMYNDDACDQIVPSDLRLLVGEIDRLRAELLDYREMVDQHRELVRRLDVALNGAGAAKQASLCDLVSQFERR